MCLSWPGQGCNYVQGEYAVSNMVAITVRGERIPETCLLLIQGSGCTEHPANASQDGKGNFSLMIRTLLVH